MSMVLGYNAALFASFKDLRIRKAKSQCIAHVKSAEPRRCLYTSNKKAVELERLETLILCAESFEGSQIEQCMRDYVEHRLCHLHRDILAKSVMIDLVARRWKTELTTSRRVEVRHTNAQGTPEPSGDANEEFRHTEFGSNNGRLQRQKTILKSQPHHIKGVVQAGGLNFQPYPKLTRTTVGKIFQTNLKPAVYAASGLYIFTRVNDPGFVKIGRSRNVNKRRSRWEKCWGPLIIEHVVENVPHAWRAESLIHSDPRLKNYRRVQRGCLLASCDSAHKEWFEVKPEQARIVMDEWASFLQQEEPYNTSGRLKDVWAVVPESIGNVTPDVLCSIRKIRTTATIDLVEDLHEFSGTYGVVNPTMTQVDDTGSDQVRSNDSINLRSNGVFELEARWKTFTSSSTTMSMSHQHSSAQTTRDVSVTQVSENYCEPSTVVTDSERPLLFVYAWSIKDMQWTGRVLLIFFWIEATAQGVSFMHRLVLAISFVLLFF